MYCVLIGYDELLPEKLQCSNLSVDPVQLAALTQIKSAHAAKKNKPMKTHPHGA